MRPTLSDTRSRRAPLAAALLFTALPSLSLAQTNLPRVWLDPGEPQSVRLNSEFGWAVSIVEGTAFVSAPNVDGRGVVYRFEVQPDRSWVLRQRLVSPDTGPGRFGEHIEQDGGTVLISDSVRERVYSFARQRDGMYRPKAALRGGVPHFGNTFTLLGCTALIASGSSPNATSQSPPGWVHVYNRCNTTPSGTELIQWTWKGSFQSPEPQNNDQFGYSLALLGTELIVGTPNNDGKGAAFYYTYAGNGSWTFRQKLVQTQAGDGHSFGRSVGFRGGLAAVGAPNTPVPSSHGQVEFFSFANGAWHPSSTLDSQPFSYSYDDGFGEKIQFVRDRVFITSFPLPTTVQGHGAIHVYRRSGDALVSEAYLYGDAFSSTFARNFDVSGQWLIIGESNQSIGPSQVGGGAAIFDLPP